MTPEPRPDRRAGLEEVLEEARSLGFLGPGPAGSHIGHAMGFAGAWLAHAPGPPTRLADLGAGGGVPGLALAAAWPDAEVVLLEVMAKRVTFLRRALERLGWPGVSVDARRAEEVGRDPSCRARVDLVVARGFGLPAVAAECAAPLLVPGGTLVVSEPPEPEERWPTEGLAPLGLVPDGLFRSEARYMVLRQVTECPSRFPRKPGIPAKRPLF